MLELHLYIINLQKSNEARSPIILDLRTKLFERSSLRWNIYWIDQAIWLAIFAHVLVI
jgi:hypothetical protein